jgi:hypothetical protein
MKPQKTSEINIAANGNTTAYFCLNKLRQTKAMAASVLYLPDVQKPQNRAAKTIKTGNIFFS